MNKTYVTRKEDVKRKWYLVDAKEKVLGRMATRIAIVLRGKHKAVFSPSMDAGDGVIVINAAKVKITGRKMKQKVYSRYSGYPGGLKQVPLETMLAKKPEMVVRLAVQRMLPGGPLGRDLIKKLKVYAGETHKQQSQQPAVLEF
ncbi:MAG: 50S ribosomal protein L13 [Candidatus Omnitrophota bacterium]|jgi:large subunit ribosomal protein L13|nr:50S ribosomal protein L13 [Candidatus Omnitrophota bacterium]